MTEPLVSVILPTNRADLLLERAVKSVLKQTLTQFELIIVDDGATGLRQCEYLAEPRIRVVAGKQDGLPSALNAGIANAATEWIARMDSDDVMHPARLERQLRYLRGHRDIDVLGTGAFAIDQAGGLLYPIVVPREHDGIVDALMCGTTGLLHPTTVLSRRVVWAVDGYDTAAPRGCEDLELWVRLAEFAHFANLRLPLLMYTVHEEQESRQADPGDTRALRVRLLNGWLAGETRQLAELIVQLERRRSLSDSPAERACIDGILATASGSRACRQRQLSEFASCFAAAPLNTAVKAYLLHAKATATSRVSYIREVALSLSRYCFWVATVRAMRWLWRPTWRLL